MKKHVPLRSFSNKGNNSAMVVGDLQWIKLQRERRICESYLTTTDMSDYPVLRNNEKKSENAFKAKGDFLEPGVLVLNVPYLPITANDLNSIS